MEGRQPDGAGGGRFEVAAGATIDTREELHAALAVAAELEQMLLAQYLFASYSMRKRPGQGLDERQVELARTWEGTILAVAREEMVHFATVTKIAVAVGAAPHLQRPAFPQPAGEAFPFEMRLEPFGPGEIERFVRFETPASQAADVEFLRLAPDMLEFEYLGELYRQILDAIVLLAREEGEAGLFVGPTALRDAERWGLNHDVREIRNSATAVAAITEVITEGEGGPEDAVNSHFQRFLRVQSQLAAELGTHADFSPSHPVVPNPVTRPGAGGTLLEGEAVPVAELFNSLYATIMLLIGQFYAPVGESAQQRAEIQATVRRSMSAILRPLAEILVELPAGGAGATGRAGAPFEILAPLELPFSTPARFAILDERLERAAEHATGLAAGAGVPRMRFISENVTLMRDAVAAIAGGREVGVARPRF